VERRGVVIIDLKGNSKKKGGSLQKVLLGVGTRGQCEKAQSSQAEAWVAEQEDGKKGGEKRKRSNHGGIKQPSLTFRCAA